MSTSQDQSLPSPTFQQKNVSTFAIKPGPEQEWTRVGEKLSSGGGIPSCSSQERPLTSSRNGSGQHYLRPKDKTSSEIPSTTTSAIHHSSSPLKSELPPCFLTAKQLLEAEGREEARVLSPVRTISFGCPHTGDKADPDVSPGQFHLCKHCELWFCRACMPKHRMLLFQAFYRKEKNTRDDELIDMLNSFY